MGTNYKSLAATAKRLIGSNGTKCVLVNPIEGMGIYNPDTNEYDKPGNRHDGCCIITSYDDKLIDGTIIQRGDRKVKAVLPVEPIPGLSHLEVYNKSGKLVEIYNIINCPPINPDASTVILYQLQCRK